MNSIFNFEFRHFSHTYITDDLFPCHFHSYTMLFLPIFIFFSFLFNTPPLLLIRSLLLFLLFILLIFILLIRFLGNASTSSYRYCSYLYDYLHHYFYFTITAVLLFVVSRQFCFFFFSTRSSNLS